MAMIRWLIGLFLGAGAALAVAASSAAGPAPSLEGTWLVRAGEGQSTLLLTCGADGSVAVTVPDGALVLADGTVWAVAPAGYGTWRSRGSSETELTIVFLSAGPSATAPSVLRLSVRVTLAVTGLQWTGTAWLEVLDGSSRRHALPMEVWALSATRVLYGRS